MSNNKENSFHKVRNKLFIARSMVENVQNVLINDENAIDTKTIERLEKAIKALDSISLIIEEVEKN